MNTTSAPQKIFTSLGELAICWNDLELHLRHLAYCLTDDWFTVAVFSADMQISALLQSIKTMATEYDVESSKLNRFIEKTRPRTNHRLLARDMITEHIDCVIECADRLRLYRNVYVHGINSPTKQVPYFTVGGVTTRATRRMSTYELPLKVVEIRKVTTAIRRASRYARRIQMCIKADQRTDRKSRTVWPKKLTPYPKMKRSYNHFTEGTSLF